MKKESKKEEPLFEKINKAYRNADQTIENFEKQREQFINQAHQAEQAGDKAKKEEFLQEAARCDVRIGAVGFSMQENFGVSCMKEKQGEEEKRWKKR